MKLFDNIKNIQVLKTIYGDNAKEQLKRYENARAKFNELFGAGEAEYFSTSGRSEIIGNHTDHQHGIVMAAGINLDAIAVVRKTDDMTVRIVSEGYADENVVDLNSLSLDVSERGTTKSLIRGIAYHMQEDLEYKIGGFCAYIQSDVLRGSGLSSSAAIEVLIYTIFNYLYNDGKLSNVEAAKTSQWAENNYFGKPCGLMDQTACALGKLVFIDFSDPKEPVIEGVDFDLAKKGYSIIITDVHADHADLTNEYAAITEEMGSVAKFFGKEYLRDVNENLFYEQLGQLREKVCDRAVMRAIHFFEEDKRVLKAVNAIKANDLDAFFKQINQSGESSWKLLQNTHATGSLNQAMTLALAFSQKLLNGKGACRVHGGGFGGTILAFVPKAEQQNYIAEMEKVFGEKACVELSIRPMGTEKVNING